ncbi:MAG: DUF5996 family protein, partial [Coriobacteriia bacterium]|nr:DUF5996 family protein [Coriobacteriia bacterium]
MNVLNYRDWQDTCDTLHMILQMLGKVKLAKMPPQPEWKHCVLHITASGFTTGLIPGGAESVEVSVDVLAACVIVRSTSGECAQFPLVDGQSVADYYAQLMDALRHVEHSASICTIPQEVYLTDDFDKQTKAVDFDHRAAKDYFRMCLVAHDALTRFSSAYRGKKIAPSLFWGTFDLTTVLFSGAPKPFPGKGVIEETAFDEQLVEFGFWPGDPSAPDPALFVMAYPFITQELSSEDVSPKEAFFSKEKGEFFLPLSALATTAGAGFEPAEVMTKFFEDAFRVVTTAEEWDNLEWLT